MRRPIALMALSLIPLWASWLTMAACATPDGAVAPAGPPPTESATVDVDENGGFLSGACFGAGVWTPSGEHGPLPDNCNHGRCVNGRWSSTTLLDCRIQILDRVYFAPGDSTLDGAALRLLAEIAAVLAANPDLPLLQVHGHASAGERDTIASQRADVVRSELMRLGISPTRLEARGFASDRPLVPPSEPAAPETNRRVEFHIPPAH